MPFCPMHNASKASWHTFVLRSDDGCDSSGLAVLAKHKENPYTYVLKGTIPVLYSISLPVKNLFLL